MNRNYVATSTQSSNSSVVTKKSQDMQIVNKIEKDIEKTLKEIDKKYYNPNFNLMGEIVNIFGDIDFEKVKLDIERLNKIDEKLDQVIKQIKDTHSDEFFRILGFVREMQKRLDYSKLKLADARDALGSITSTISNLSTGENSEWKFKSIFTAEIISKLNKTQRILEIIHDCEVYIDNSKLFDAIILLKNSAEEHLNYDKEFRSFNLLVSINLRFKKIEESIEDKLLFNLNKILFFTEELSLNGKVNSLLAYFLNFYSKISIDTEVSKPLEKFAYIIKNTVSNNLSSCDFDYNDNFNDNVIDVESENKLSSLIYLIKCFKSYDCTSLFNKFLNGLNVNLGRLLERSMTLTIESLKQVNFTKYELENKVEKIKILLYFQTPLLILFHTLSKIVGLSKYLPNRDALRDKVLSSLEKVSMLPLIIYNKYAAPRGENETENFVEASEFYETESFVKQKINEILIHLDNLPMIYKIYFKFCQCTEKLHGVKLERMKSQLNAYNSQLFKHYSFKIIPKKYFDISTFIYDYDSDVSNFKFISDLIAKINKMKELLTFAFDSSYLEIMKIVKDLFTKYLEDTRQFSEKLRKDCVHSYAYNILHENLLKMKEYNEISIDLQYKKYEKKLIDVSGPYDNNKFNNILMSYMSDSCKSVKLSDNMYLLTRNYKLLELITKFISCTESLVNMGENFVFDLMRQEFNSAKTIAILEQVNAIHFEVFSKDVNDIPSLIMLSLKTFEKISAEIVKLVLLCRIEFVYLITSLIRNMSKNEYWLNEPQMTPEYFVNSFVNDFTMFNNLFQYNLNGEEYNFISKDYLLFVNNAFIHSLKCLSSNSINNFGVNLLVRNFDFIKDKIETESGFDDPKFTQSIYYFPNYIKLLNCNEESIQDELVRYYEVSHYDQDFIMPLLKLRTSSRHTLHETDKVNIIHTVFKQV